jgi:hypothetical protein
MEVDFSQKRLAFPFLWQLSAAIINFGLVPVFHAYCDGGHNRSHACALGANPRYAHHTTTSTGGLKRRDSPMASK